MLSLSLCQKVCPNKLPKNLSNEIGYGADGQIFNIIDDPNKVIKISVLYDIGQEFSYEPIDKNLSYIQENKPTFIVTVYEHAFLARSKRKTYVGEQEYIIHYYIMEKLNKITEDEKKVFHSILSHEDNCVVKKYSKVKINALLRGMQYGLDFDYKKIFDFHQSIMNSNITHNDIHARNIMKDNIGNFKLIDLDRLEIKNEKGNEG